MNSAEYNMQLEVGKVIGGFIATFLLTSNYCATEAILRQRSAHGVVRKSRSILPTVSVLQVGFFNRKRSIFDDDPWSPPQRTWKARNQNGRRPHQYK